MFDKLSLHFEFLMIDIMNMLRNNNWFKKVISKYLDKKYGAN